MSLRDPDNPTALLDMLNRTYVAQSGLVGTDGPDASSTGRPIYQAEENQYVINTPTDISIQTTTQSGLIVIKTFSIDPTRYDVQITHTIQNTSDTAKTVSPFVQLKRDNSADPSIQNSMGMQAFLGMHFEQLKNDIAKYRFQILKRQLMLEISIPNWRRIQ